MSGESLRQSNVYEYKYSGDFEAIDAVAVLQTQLTFISIVTEIKNQIAPDSRLDIKIQGLKKGSLEVHQIIELVTPLGLFVTDNYDTVKTIFKILGDLFKIKSLLGSKKADEVTTTDNSVTIMLNVEGNNNTIVVSPEAWKLYQDNQKINDGLIRTAKTLDERNEVKQIEVKQHNNVEPVAKINKSDFSKIKEENAYSISTFQYEYDPQQIIGIKKANLLPEAGRVLKWDVLYRGQTVSIKISDQSFIDQILNGLKFGNGDKLQVDIKKSMRLDKTYNMFIETGQYEATKVQKLISRDQQTNMEF